MTEKISSILFIPSEKLQNSVVVLGTFDGKIIITKSPINEADYKYKELFVHKGRITKLIYSKETHLLFSCGDDGNIFITIIQEIDGDDEAFYESLILNIGQVSDLKNSDLGENILLPSWEMDKIEKTKGKKDILEKEFEGQKKEILDKHENEINCILKDMKNNQNEEINKMIDKLSELELEIKRQNDENRDNYNSIINEMRIKQSEEYNLYEVASSDYEQEIVSLRNQLAEIDRMYEEECQFLENEYQHKFFEIKKYFQKRTRDIKEEDDKIENDYLREKDNKNVFVTNLEVENEIDNKNILLEQDKVNDEYKNKIKKLKQEIENYKKRKLELEEILEEKEKETNSLQKEVIRSEENARIIKDQNNQISTEINNLKQKIIELKKIMEDKKITNEFEEKLRKELYKKNTEINNKYKEVIKEHKIQKDKNRLLERNINKVNTKALLIEDGRGKAYLALSANERENIKLKRKSAQLKNLLEEIIAKVHKSLQSINKNEVYKCACELYKLFLTDEYKNTIKKKTLDVDILYEFRKKIKNLEKKLNSDKEQIKFLQERHNNYKRKMFVDNSSLLSGCTNVTKRSINLLKNMETLSTEIKNLEETKNYNNSSLIGNYDINNKKSNLSNTSKDILPPITQMTSNKNKGGSFGSEKSSSINNGEDNNL